MPKLHFQHLSVMIKLSDVIGKLQGHIVVLQLLLKLD